MQVGDKVAVHRSFRSLGVIGGWKRKWWPAIIEKINPKTIVVRPLTALGNPFPYTEKYTRDQIMEDGFYESPGFFGNW